MVRYQSYLLHQLAATTLIVAFSLTSIVWLMQALRFIDFIVNRGVSILTFLHLTSLLLPSLITMILPLAVLFATLYVYHRLSQDSELVVFFAAGLSRFQLAVPALKWSAMCCVFLAVMMHVILPITYRQFKDLQVFLRDNYASVMLQEDVFNNPADGLTVFVRERDENGRLKGVLLHDGRDNSKPMTLMAREATLQQTPTGPRFLLVDGSRQEIQKDRLSMLYFDRYPIDFNLYSKNSAARPKRIDEFMTGALIQSLARAGNEYDKRLAEIHHRFTWPLVPVVLALLSTWWLVSGHFNRRGQGKRVAQAAAIGIAFIGVTMTLQNAAASQVWIGALMYLNVFGMLAAIIWQLRESPIGPVQATGGRA